MKTKEFFSKWKQGIEQITPLQQMKVSIIGSIFVLIGVIIGVITTFIFKQWWLFVILLGSLLVTGIGFVGTLQRYFALQKIDKIIKGEIDNGTVTQVNS